MRRILQIRKSWLPEELPCTRQCIYLHTYCRTLPSLTHPSPWRCPLLLPSTPYLPHPLASYSTSSPPELLDASAPFAYYTILNLPQSASQSDIKAAYYLLARQHHPDVAGDDEISKQNFAAITLAYTVLRDPTEKYHYDLHGLPREEFQRK